MFSSKQGQFSMRMYADLSGASQAGALLSSHREDLPSTLTYALETLKAGDFQARWEISKQLSEFGEAAIAPLLAIAKNNAHTLELRWFAIRALGAFVTPQVVTELVSFVKAADEDLRDIAIKTLADMGAPSIHVLTQLLSHPKQRLLAVQALSQIRQTAVIEPLLSVVNDADPQLRYLAIESLGSFHNQRITPVLLCALSDTSAHVRQSAIVTLGRRPDLRDAYSLIDKLKPCLWDLNLAVCKVAAAAIGRLGGAGAADALRQVLLSTTTPDDLRIQAVRALGWLQTEAGLQTLAEALRLNLYSDRVCNEIIKVLGQAQTPLQALAISELSHQLRSPQFRQAASVIKQSLVMSLGNLGATSTFKDLTALLSDADQRVRLHTLAALRQLSPQTGHHQLRALLASNPLPPALQAEIEESLETW
ncbi:MAG: HEAT repeat domain-containing protein [Cyanobacteria bacterium P01_A01_bin.114]